LSIGIGLDFRNIVSSVRLRITIDRIIIKDDNDAIEPPYSPKLTALLRLRISAYTARRSRICALTAKITGIIKSARTGAFSVSDA
jgi:hypothetical protein